MALVFVSRADMTSSKKPHGGWALVGVGGWGECGLSASSTRPGLRPTLWPTCYIRCCSHLVPSMGMEGEDTKQEEV